jgi:diguanylate cyclase (GGDEF)-like protein
MIDIDNLKSINHRLGHTVGDAVLKQVATLVASIMRKNDVFGRFGGEEFIVCLPNTSSEFAMDIAERIRLCIQEHTWQLDNVDNVCVSIGLAYLENDIDLIRLISCADEQLYQAKASGRNRVCSI